MDKKSLFSKWLAIGIILLFVGIAVAPNINQCVVTASQDDDFVDVTTQTCGIKGYENTTVRLTREQYQNLEQYLVEFRAKLNQTTTREEAVPIFKETVVELDKYGLLPKGMSVEEVQQLVMGDYWNQRHLQLLEKIYGSNPRSQNEVQDQFCFVTGKTSHTYFIGPISLSSFALLFITMRIYYAICLTLEALGFENVAMGLATLVDKLFEIRFAVRFIPFEIGASVTFGFEWYEPDYGLHWAPSNGWLYTVGIKGNQSIEGLFYGTLEDYLPGVCKGISGFTGIILGRRFGTEFFLGSAFRVSVGPTPY